MTTVNVKKTFDCVEMMHEGGARIHEKLNLNPAVRSTDEHR